MWAHHFGVVSCITIAKQWNKSYNSDTKIDYIIKCHQNVSQGTDPKVEGMCPHVMKIGVTASKVTSDPARPKKTSKTKKPEPTDFLYLRTVHPAHDLNALGQYYHYPF